MLFQFQLILVLILAHIAHHHLIARLQAANNFHKLKVGIAQLHFAFHNLLVGIAYKKFILPTSHIIAGIGLQPGDEVVVSDMSNYKNKNKLKLK